MTETFKEVALRVLREAAAACPAQGEVPLAIADTMFNAAVAATLLGATQDEIGTAMNIGYLEHDMEVGL